MKFQKKEIPKKKGSLKIEIPKKRNSQKKFLKKKEIPRLRVVVILMPEWGG